ncbi:MAG: signal peptidase II [Bdellovibrionales bacterium]|nr:signal peptidase II [Bdellovibrionales bacterium]
MRNLLRKIPKIPKVPAHRYAVFFASMGVVTVLDQFTKELAIIWLKGRIPIAFLDNFFRFEYAENPGAFLGLGSSLNPATRFLLMTIAVALILVFCGAYVLWDKTMPKIATLGFSMVVAGGFSNLLDRIFRTEGRVVDFMNMGIGTLRTGIFNIADMAIMAGIFIVFFQSFKPQPKR